VFADNFGRQWTVDHLATKIVEKYSSKDRGSKPVPYITRITVLHCLPRLASVMDASEVESKLLPVILTGLTDAVPNVRFIAASTGSSLVSSGYLSSATIRDELVHLRKDPDSDVKYFANLALSACGS